MGLSLPGRRLSPAIGTMDAECCRPTHSGFHASDLTRIAVRGGEVHGVESCSAAVILIRTRPGVRAVRTQALCQDQRASGDALVYLLKHLSLHAPRVRQRAGADGMRVQIAQQEDPISRDA